MEKTLKIISIIFSILLLMFLGFLALIYIPSPKFEPVVSFFKDKVDENTDERMMKITLKDLLTMQSGIRSQDSYIYGYRGLFGTMATDEWVAHILSLPIDTEAGTRFDYSNLNSFLISAIISRSTDMDTLTFAQKYLFDPLGIEDVYWETSPQGIHLGFARMWLKPRDMAKFGMLYLQQGKWEDQQIIRNDWILESLTPHAYPKNYVDILDVYGKKDAEASQRTWVGNKLIKPFTNGYGYQWWLDEAGNYSALGTSGQFITVVPKENMVIGYSAPNQFILTFDQDKIEIKELSLTGTFTYSGKME